ncbi:MAG: alpha/beta hydrolase [Lachnospiraceae bacterium]
MKTKSQEELTIQDLMEDPTLGNYRDFFWTFITEDHLQRTLASYGYEKCGFAPCLEDLRELTKAGMDTPWNVYTRQEIYENHDLQEAKLFYFPPLETAAESGSQKKDENPAVVIIPGGGFARQWGLIEGLCIASCCRHLGYPSFVLFYRTSKDGVVASALQDIVRAIQWIGTQKDRFSLSTDRYLLGGFSAGATLAALLGTRAFSAEHFGLKKPERMFLCYAAAAFDHTYDVWKAAHPDGRTGISPDGNEIFLRRVCGKTPTRESALTMSPLYGLDAASCPPLFLAANRDDDTVPFENSLSLASRAKEEGIPLRTRFGAHGGHSFGLGNGLDVDGWLPEFLSWNV